MTAHIPYNIYSLGDSAITIDYGNIIDEEVNNRVLQLFNDLKANPLPGMIEAVPAYSSVTVYYDVHKLKKHSQQLTAYDMIRTEINARLDRVSEKSAKEERLVKIPVCYAAEFGTDLQNRAATKNLTVAEIIQHHISKIYRVYMIGFLPGFPYMGVLNDKISMPRKEKPVPVKAGSVGIAGVQTGIYPFDSPGGWQIIGRTPLKLFNKEKDQPAYLKPGDNIQFYSISKDDYYKIKNSPLPWRGAGGEA